jgi:hypothetical protein
VAVLQGAVVALPRPDSFGWLLRLRSPAWAGLMPGSILFGTFGVLARPSLAALIVAVAALCTPALAILAVLGGVPGRRTVVAVTAGGLAAGTLFAHGWVHELSSAMLTGLGCIALGTALVRLIPGRWIAIGMISMCVIDVLLLAVGVGQPAANLLADATANFHGPALNEVTIGPITLDYPDLVVAAVLGATLAGHPSQPRAALMVTAMAACYGLILPPGSTMPATVPVALTYVFVVWRRGLREPARVGRSVAVAQRA